MRSDLLGGRRRAFALFFLPALYLAVTQASATEEDAKKILKSMSDYLASQTSFSLTFDSAVEVITPAMEKIQFTSSGDVTMARPSSLHASRKGGYADVEMFFDGKTVTVYGKNLNGYAEVDAPGTVDQAIDALHQRGIAIPGADLLLSNVYDTLMADVLEAKVIGEGVVEGVECDHLAFRGQEIDWQLWIERGDRPVPRKYVITTKSVGGAPQYTLVIKDWQFDVSTTAATFTFEAPQGAQVLAADALDTLNDVPPPAPAEGQ